MELGDLAMKKMPAKHKPAPQAIASERINKSMPNKCTTTNTSTAIINNKSSHILAHKCVNNEECVN